MIDIRYPQPEFYDPIPEEEREELEAAFEEERSRMLVRRQSASQLNTANATPSPVASSSTSTRYSPTTVPSGDPEGGDGYPDEENGSDTELSSSSASSTSSESDLELLEPPKKKRRQVSASQPAPRSGKKDKPAKPTKKKPKEDNLDCKEAQHMTWPEKVAMIESFLKEGRNWSKILRSMEAQHMWTNPLPRDQKLAILSKTMSKLLNSAKKGEVAKASNQLNWRSRLPLLRSYGRLGPDQLQSKFQKLDRQRMLQWPQYMEKLRKHLEKENLDASHRKMSTQEVVEELEEERTSTKAVRETTRQQTVERLNRQVGFNSSVLQQRSGAYQGFNAYSLSQILMARNQMILQIRQLPEFPVTSRDEDHVEQLRQSLTLLDSVIRKKLLPLLELSNDEEEEEVQEWDM